jgi:predicted DNA-binding protein
MARQDTQVAVRIPPELHKQLKEKAVNEERSMSYLININKAVEQFLKQQESAKA